MDEFTTITATLKNIIEQLEDNNAQNHKTKSSKYTTVQVHLAKKGYVNEEIFQRVLNICVRDLEQDIKYTAIALKLIMTILNKIKNEGYSPDPASLVPSAVCIIRKINMTSILNNVDNIRILHINAILLYPDETLITVVSNNEAIIVELFMIHNYAQLQQEYKILLYDFLYRLFTILPKEIKISFLNSVTPILFSKVIPSILDDISCVTVEKDILKLLEVLEYITNELCEIDYFKIPQWMSFVENICNPKKYPQMMKNLLEKESQAWHRLWIIFIKLLKNRITSNIISSGTPINSMLPIVETAFKLDPINRGRAFECWTVLINVFAYETNENCINKRLKLLIIPFVLNNAKLEETVIAKFDSWWHLINRFQMRFEKFVEQILISFLRFCFGKHSSSGKSSFVPGQLSNFLKKQCVDAFVEIIGHVNCPGCVDITRLEGKLINTKNLANYWMDWTYSLKVALQISLDNITDSIPQQALCLLQSFLLTTSCLPNSKIKEDIINDLLTTLLEFVQESKQHDIHYADTVFTLLLSIFIDELKEILSIKGENENILYKIIKLTLDPCFKKYYEMRNKQEMSQKLKPMAKYLLQDSVGLQYIIDHILSSLPVNDISLTFWTSLLEQINQSDNDFDLQHLFSILIWPLESLNMFNEVKYPAKLWYTTYSRIYLVLGKGDFDRAVSQILNSSNIVTNSSIYFALYVILAILKCGLNTEDPNKYETDVQLLQVLSKRIDCYEDIEELFPELVDTLILLLQSYNSSNNNNIAETVICCVKNVLKFMMSVFKGNSNVVKVSVDMENLLKAIDLALKSEAYSQLFYLLTNFTTFYSKVFQNLTLSIFTKPLNTAQVITPNKDNNDKETNLNIETKTLSKKTIEGSKFSTPNTKEAKKKTKKNEASIVNTVVENGEEFVVVQSNWKFNPKKLTENQKEKLKRKREDIPALYQDLSQSQDEVNIRAWKTDSQDSITTSKSCSTSTNEGQDASSILKKISNIDVVPTIMENILAEKEKNEPEAAHKEITKSSGENDKILTNRDCKTPRMALKDRVFRNVRNLIEKSKNENISGDAQTTYNQIENTFRTPTTKKITSDITSLVKSAPPLPLSERPSRVIKKPKKFVDAPELTKRHLKKKSDKDKKIINETNSINTINNDIKHENTDIVKNSSLLSEREVDVVTGNIGIQNENATVDSDKSIVKSLDTIESTKSLRVKLIKNGFDKIIDKCNITIVKTDLKSDQNESPKEQEIVSECQNTPVASDNNSTPQPAPDQKSPTHNNYNDVHKSPVKSIIRKRKSRIETELAIDMAIGYLNEPLVSRKRLTRKNLARHMNAPKRRRLTDKLSQSLEDNVSSQQDKKVKSVNKDSVSITVIEVQNESSTTDHLLPENVTSEDIIESSQDSTLTTVTVTKKALKKLPVICIENTPLEPKLKQYNTETQNLLEESCQQIIEKPTEKSVTCNNICTNNEVDVVSTEDKSFDKSKDNNTASELDTSLTDSYCKNNKPETSLINHQSSKDDTELPQNKTDDQNISDNNLTENMNTEEICNNDLSDDVIIIVKELMTPIDVSSDENLIGVGTQEIADAATQPVNQTELCSETGIDNNTSASSPVPFNNNCNENDSKTENITDIQKDSIKTITQTETITTLDLDKTNDISSPFKDDDERKQDFMNNTLEISPIKRLSPHKCNEKSPSPDKSNECIVIVLSSPVQCNGEPIEKESPEIFTEDKPSDKIECSPTRSGINISNTSPSSSLSTKKNRPQVYGGGRAAQMLGLCVPEKNHSSLGSDKSNIEEVKRNNPPNTPARRNLRILYNSTNDNNEAATDNEESGSFLKLKRVLPATDCSPSGPILKRKFIDIIDDVIISPASKRKRVSFHDPPVSTTVSVQKYIEPLGVRSPQNSAQKRQERQLRSQNCKKSPRRLDNVFNLNTALTKAVESFGDGDLPTSNDDTQMTSLGQTPTAEIVKASELNDTEPICIELLDCKDPIENIATELSSATMKSLLIKELEGKIETIGDLARMTEVEVNRLCIKAPKVKVAKQALNEYYIKLVDKETNLDDVITVIEPIEGDNNKFIDMETQTDKLISVDVEMQTTPVQVTATSMQTDVPSSSTASIQTDESGYKSTADVIKTCILERNDFLEQLTEELGETEMQMIVEKLSFSALTDLYMKNINVTNANVALSRVLDHESIQRSVDNDSKSNQLSYIRDYLLDKFSSKDLNLFCIHLLRELHDKFT